MTLLTRNAYAKLCGVSRQAIADRIARGTLKTIEKELPDGSKRQYIDTEVYPKIKAKYLRPPNKKT